MKRRSFALFELVQKKKKLESAIIYKFVYKHLFREVDT